MKKLKTVMKHAGFHTAAWVYRNGVVIEVEETYKGNKVTVMYFLPKQIKFRDPELARVVLHHAADILPFGVPEEISTHHDNDSETTKKLNLKTRAVVFHYKHGGRMHFDEVAYPDPEHPERPNDVFHNSDITAQGTGFWKSPWASDPDWPERVYTEGVDPEEWARNSINQVGAVNYIQE